LLRNLAGGSDVVMPFGLTVALFVAQAAAAAPASTPDAASEASAPAALRTADPCRRTPDPNASEIVICAEKPQGYRIDPDIMTVKRLKRSGGRPTRPGPGAIKDTSRCIVGPAGCPSAGINLLGAALTAGEMASRLSKGEEIGSMFVTDPQPNDYQLYQEAKREREAKAEEKAVAKANGAKARTAPGATPQRQP
jgi:hypothetical protein